MTQKKGLKFLIVSKWGDALDLAYRLKNEQHEVLMSIQDRDSKEIGFGFVRKTNQWEKYTDWADVIVFDYTGFGAQADELRKQGKLVFGGSTYTDQLELDRNFGHLELIKHKIKTIPSKEFTNFPEAIDYIRAHPDCYVIKPCGETQEYKQLLFVGKDDQGHDVIKMLEAYQKTWGANHILVVRCECSLE